MEIAILGTVLQYKLIWNVSVVWNYKDMFGLVKDAITVLLSYLTNASRQFHGGLSERTDRLTKVISLIILIMPC